jgi:hypothetical protein
MPFDPRQAVLVKSTELQDATIVKGPDFNSDARLDFSVYKQMGFQATNLGLAMERIEEMV